MTVTYYIGSVLDGSLLTTANDVSISSGASAVGKDTAIGALTGYGELVPNNSAGTWPAYGSESAVPFSGKGQIYPTSLLNQAHPSGNWTPTLRCSVVGTSPVAVTADLIFRVWTWNSGTLAKTKIGTVTLAAQSITTTSTTFSLPATSLSHIAFNTNDYLYFDVVANVTSNPNGAGVGAKIRCNFSNSSSTGNATGQVIAPSLASCRFVSATVALQATSTRTITATATLQSLTLTRTIGATVPLAKARSIPATVALQGAAITRTVPCTASMCHGPLGLPYVQLYTDTNYITASGTHLVYKSSNIKLYGCTIYMSVYGGAATWQGTSAYTFQTVIDDLFFRAWRNGLNLIRITDFWDSSHITAFDNATVWANIDYCVTKAQQYGMFLMMDVSAYKNILIANNQDWTVAANWSDYLTFVGQHYKGTATSICWYNCLGEPSVPTDQASTDALASFYNTLCNTIHAADNGTHLIEAGGLTHMNTVVSGISYPAWWYPIYTLANNNIMAYKTYSTNDLTYLSTVHTILTNNNITKPLSNNEFGAQQQQGDVLYPTFENTLATAITAHSTVTSLALNTPLAQTLVAQTIIAVGAENFVVSTTTSSGSTLPVQSVTAQANHSAGDSMVALGYAADPTHSLGDTVDHYFKAVFGTSTSIMKWNATPRTLVPTTVPGGDQIGTTSYVMWNLGDQVQASGYDVSNTVMPGAWAVIKNKALGDGYTPVPITIRQVPCTGVVGVPYRIVPASVALQSNFGTNTASDALYGNAALSDALRGIATTSDT